MAYSRKDVDKTKQNAKKFVRYQEGAEKYSMVLTKFTALAKEAKAVYKIDKVTLVNSFITSPRIVSSSDMVVSLLARFIEMLLDLSANFSMSLLFLLLRWSITFSS